MTTVYIHHSPVLPQVKCTWILLTYVKQVDYARVEDMNFTSARKMKADIGKSIENLDDNSLHSSVLLQKY